MVKVIKNSLLLYVPALLMLILGSCRGKVKNEKELYAWLENDENNFVKRTAAENWQITVKYLPPILQVVREAGSRSLNENQMDSLEKLYEQSPRFLLTLKPTGRMDEFSKGYDAYRQFIESVNFSPERLFSIKTADSEYFPALSTYENTFGQNNSKSVYIVFSDAALLKSLEKKPEFQFIFRDLFLDTGISGFDFNWNQLKKYPKIDLR